MMMTFSYIFRYYINYRNTVDKCQRQRVVVTQLFLKRLNFDGMLMVIRISMIAFLISNLYSIDDQQSMTNGNTIGNGNAPAESTTTTPSIETFRLVDINLMIPKVCIDLI